MGARLVARGLLMCGFKCRKALLLSSAMAGVLCCAAIGASAQAPAAYQFDIPAESLSQALKDFSAASSQQIVFSDQVIGDRKVPALHGSYTRDQALGMLLAGTDLHADVSQSGVIMVRPKNAQAAANDAAAANQSEAIESVIVTGSHLQGVAPSSPTITITRGDIDASGYSNTGDVIRSLTVASGSGVQPMSQGTTGFGGHSDVSYASSVNLRGLGSESTLTLIDGHRIASDGFVGSVVDVSAIPLSAIDHVEIVTDGASAIYGSDAVAGVANFILRKDYDGAQTTLHVGTSSDGGATEYQASQLVGMNWGSGGGLVSYDFYHQATLYNSSRPYSAATPGPFSLTPGQDRQSVFGSVHQDLTSDISLFAEGLFSIRSAHHAENISGIREATDDDVAHLYGVTAGIDWNINPDWHASLAETISSSIDYDNSVIAGTAPSYVRYRNGLKNLEGVVSGNLFDLPAGAVSVAAGAGYRFETYSDYTNNLGHRTVAYGFGELSFPLVAPSSERIGLERLEITAAGRYESYSDFGGSGNPKVGLVYSPVADLTVRGTWSTAFRAPGIELEKSPQQVVIDPGTLFAGAPPTSQVLILAGGNSNLQPETSTTWSAGADYISSDIPGLKTSVTVFSVGYGNRITTPIPSTAAAFTVPANAPFITYNPSAALQSQIIQQAAKVTNFTKGYNPALVYALLNRTQQNFVSENARGVDLSASYQIDTSSGDFTLTSNVSWLRLSNVGVAGAAAQQITGTVFNPPEMKMREGLTWHSGSWSSSLFANYISGETNTTAIPNAHVKSWTTFDWQGAVDLSGVSSELHGFKFSIALRNIFDRDPPFVGTNAYIASYFSPGYDPANASPLGRFVGVTLTKDW